ncbi:MAG TPA: TolC family protein [Chitinophagales bacterium]|nr:TolC family protein [Chitinophagales bacterium]
MPCKNLKTFLSLCTIIVLVSFCTISKAQDTLKMTVQDAEKQFLQKNLSLIAEKYNIDINKAAIKQAKIWDNPDLSFASNIYDGNKYPFYHAKSNYGGQFDVSWTQLFKVAKQRKKLTDLLTDNALIAEQQFNDVMNSLRYTLKTDLYTVVGLLETQKMYKAQLDALQPLVSGMDVQLEKGNISAKENLRIKALVFDLQSNILENNHALTETEVELRELLQLPTSTFILPQLSITDIPTPTVTTASIDSLLEVAKNNRPDYKVALLQSTQQEHNLTYQKALAKPNVSAGLAYGHQGNYASNLVSFQIGLPIPVFDRNQVNIQIAKIGINQQNAQNEVLISKIKSDIDEAILKLTLSYQLYSGQQKDFMVKYDDMLLKMLQSYKNKEIGLLDFTDFIGSYSDTKLQLINQLTNIKKNIEDLNLACGTTIIPNN